MNMNRLRCTTLDYDRLYARWLDRPGSLLDLAGYEPGPSFNIKGHGFVACLDADLNPILI